MENYIFIVDAEVAGLSRAAMTLAAIGAGLPASAQVSRTETQIHIYRRGLAWFSSALLGVLCGAILIDWRVTLRFLRQRDLLT